MHSIIAFSDSHSAPLPQKLLDVANEADKVFFLGDGTSALGDLLFHKGLEAVDGNCDRPAFGDEKVIELDGVKILLTHGHKYSVKRDLLQLALRANELNCKAVFYGHTHSARVDERGGVTLVCVGSPCYPVCGCASYAYAATYDGKIVVKIVNLV